MHQTVRRTIIGAAAAIALAVPVALPATLSDLPTASAASQVVKEGQRGDRVTAVQHLLNAQGAKIDVDGSFGPATKKAVTDFQSKNGLEADGVVGPNTVAKLAPVIKSGDKGGAVKAAQTMVDTKADGVFGPNTKKAVSAYQKDQGLEQDGIVGPNTWSAMLLGKAGDDDGGGGGGGEDRPGGSGTYAGVPLDKAQANNARVIMSVAKGHDFNRDAQIIALMTAMQESTMKNVNYGDRDSLGLFQQRPSMGWGSRSQVTDPVLATRAFLGVASHTSNPGLKDIKGWENMRKTEAAQAVQRSAYPEHYAKWEKMATEFVDANSDVKPQK